MAKNTVVVSCPQCGVVVEAELDFLRRSAKCPKCKYKINLRQESIQIVTCSHCHNDVVFDARKSGNQLCPVCRNPLKSKLTEHKIENVPCPKCHQLNEVNIQDEDHNCVICGAHFSPKHEWDIMHITSMDPITIDSSAENPNLMWEYCDVNGVPVTRFAYGSRLLVHEGTTALLHLNGKCSSFAPPCEEGYLLSDTRLSLPEQLEKAVTGPRQVVSVRVMFVKTQLSQPVPFASQPIPIEDADGIIMGKLNMPGQYVNVRIVDSKKFADFVGYRTQTEEDLLVSGQPDTQTKLRIALRETAVESVMQAAQELIRRERLTGAQLENRRDMISQEAKNIANARLADIGLATTKIIIEKVIFTPDDTRQQIRRYVERLYQWASVPMPIHMPGNEVLAATLALKGTFKLYVKDEARFLTRSEVAGWMTGLVSEVEVQRYCESMVTELLKNALPNIIQPFIDNNSINIREMQRYYHLLRNSAEGYLNTRLDSYGLMLEQFVLEEQSFRMSDALQKSVDVATHKVTGGLEVEDTLIENDTYLQKDSILLKSAMRKDENDAMREELQRRQEARRLEYARASLRDQTELDRLSREQQHILRDDEDSYVHRKELERLGHQNEVEDLRHRGAVQSRLRSAEEMRVAWEQQVALENQQLEAQIRQKERMQEAAIHSQQTEAQARRKNERDEAENKQLLGDIMRKIAESELDTREKLDAYERLCRNNKVSDELRNLGDAAKAKAEAAYTLEHSKLLLSKEESELLSEMEQQAEDREERRKEAEFQREMKLQETQVLHEMEKLKLEYDKAAKEAEMEERFRDQQAEIEKLRLMLDHYVQIGKQGVDVQMAAYTADTIRAQAEREYAAVQAQDAKEEAQRQERARIEREDKFSDQAERLLNRMWEIQGAMDKLRSETEQKQIEGQAQVGVAHAKADSDKIDNLVKSLEKMVHSVNDAIFTASEQVAASQQAVNPPVTPPKYNQAERRCPKCGRAVSPFASLCECGQYLG